MKKIKHQKKLQKTEPIVIVTKKNIFKGMMLPFIVSFLVIFSGIFFGVKLIKLIKLPVKGKLVAQIIKPKVSQSRLKEYLEMEQSLFLDPLDLVDLIKAKNQGFVLVDLRKQKSFKKEHIKSATNFSLKNINDELEKYRNKTIVLYDEISYSNQIKELAINLLGRGYQVKILSVGWNEFRHFKMLWVPESMWDILNPDDYIESYDN